MDVVLAIIVGGAATIIFFLIIISIGKLADLLEEAINVPAPLTIVIILFWFAVSCAMYLFRVP